MNLLHSISSRIALCVVFVAVVSSSWAMEHDAKIYVAGHRGLVGSAIVRKLEREGFSDIIVRTHQELDLRNPVAVNNFFAQERPDYVFLAAAKVGGIKANSDYPAQFIYDNLMIECNIINAAYENGVKKLLFLGSSCIYPRECPQPIKEEYLLSGPLEKTNDAYAIAKIAGIKLCQAYNQQYDTRFICCMPTNLYGPHDNFDLKTSHVLPALIRKIYEAQQQGDETVPLWGTGKPYREFLHVDDLADACLFLMQYYEGSDIINVGMGNDITIAELAQFIARVIGYEGSFTFDPSMPDGTPRKLLDVSRLHALGWQPQFSLEEGINNTVTWYESQQH